MKKNIIGLLMVLTILISASCLIGAVSASDNGNNGTDIQTVSKGGVVIKFPSDWGIAQSTSNISLISIAELSSIGADKVAAVTINIEKKPIKGTFDNFINSTYTSMQKDSSFNLSSSGAVAIGDMQGMEYTYVSDINGTVKEHKAIWIEHNDDAYVILYSAPLDQFDENVKVFDYVVHNLEITA